MSESVRQMADRLRARNVIDAEIGRTIKRPMTAGHLGEWIASEVLGVELEHSATARAIDGRFTTFGPPGKSVNVKWYLKREGLLDVVAADGPDYYLVFTGPAGAAVSSRGVLRPWCISHAYVFDGAQLLEEQRERGVKSGVASSVLSRQWTAAEIYPTANPTFPLAEEQRELLRMFSPEELIQQPGG